ncbi:MAG: hypothetical protein KZQ66_09040 [Candidatus Thiodiazotropha sp. (ex Lucinoma aequizonata)]|nr:hypothetical protein [Candidatus Thiodiazotropha sp. (ex Lucinoma aequizonata)]MCU7888333.1 hypothetical protein [Candidatus Thiodiazotropha sp. (ex Lucinoma aequizonata)]MCU7895542.1 hypothetical protein [Candidatus Thiodiazotropha sp. (ex Lucinoma aequizonata)]MCU7899877.1 hypothetical protein [Candidatus Thiodiazotropha sp. (ex Lucinoma aequizonata)]MCU7902117.1 hypothetical protein [Candidatus Thiodiazotropha sp. (ex Lucinoma aequizonata)]
MNSFEYFLRVAIFSTSVKSIVLNQGVHLYWTTPLLKGSMPIYILPIINCSWERDINENINGLIRQYFPKGTDFNKVSDEQIEQVMDRLNNRLR